MKTYILSTLVLCFFSFQALSQMIEIDDQLVTSQKITFLTTDGQQVFGNIADLFRDKTYLEPGYVFTVVNVQQSCKTKKHIGKYIRHCERNIFLKSDNCGVENTDEALEQIVSSRFKMLLTVEAGQCNLVIRETRNNAGMFSSASVKILAEKSELKEYLVLLK